MSETGQEPKTTAQRVAEQVFPETQSTGQSAATAGAEGAPTDDSKLTLEQALAELTKVRREAAGRRVLTREQEQQLTEYQKLQDAQKTELQKAQERVAELERKSQQYEAAQQQVAAARAAGLPLEWADRVRGNSDEERLADAKKLAESLKGTTPKGSQGGLFGGARGQDLGARPQSTAQQVNDWIRNGGR